LTIVPCVSLAISEGLIPSTRVSGLISIQLEHPIMPECQNCGSFVTERYVRVFAPDGMDHPRACPACPDKVRDGADVREAKAVRQARAVKE